jgi:DNA-binding Lrp family transcriptional regulator
MLSSFDRQLVLALQQNGRATNVELARRLDAHVSTIAKRILWLEDHDIIKVRALPNPFKLGYTAHAIIAIKAHDRKIDEICIRLNEVFNVNLIVTAFGRYDILATAYFPTWEKLLGLVSSQLSSVDGVIVDIFLVKEIKKRYYGLNADNIVPVKFDDIDQFIIERLTENGRYKSQRLAKELGISPPTCLRRISRLLEEKVIEIKAIPNPSKIGYASNAFMFLRIKADKLENVCATLGRYKDIFLVMTLFNSYDVLIGMNASSPEELYKFKNELVSLEGVVNSEIVIRAEIKKRYYGGFLE